MSYLNSLFNAGAQVYEVGGCVRDELLELPIKDHDLIVLNLSLNRLKNILKKHGSVNLVGKSFGVIKFKEKGSTYELDIALPRLEKSTGLHHRDFEVNFDETIPLEEDLKRRDFTLNAMARDLKTGELIDPFGGQKDLENKILRQVFDECFVEDPLRLLRAVQFTARFELTVEKNTLEAMKKHAHLIDSVSVERLVEEVGKLFKAKSPSIGFYLMKQTGLLQHVFPELHKIIGIEQPAKGPMDVFDHTMQVLDAAASSSEMDHPGDLELLFASLFHDVGKANTQNIDPKTGRLIFHGHQDLSEKLARRWLKHYRASMLGIKEENVLRLIKNHMFEAQSDYTDKAIRRFIYKIGKDLIFKLIDLRIADKKGGAFPDKLASVQALKQRILEELEKKPPFGPKDLQLNGQDLMEMGYPEGPLLGKIINDLVEWTLDEPKRNEAETLKTYVKKNYKL